MNINSTNAKVITSFIAGGLVSLLLLLGIYFIKDRPILFYENPEYYRSKIFDLSHGAIVSRALFSFAELQIADYLSDTIPQQIDKSFAESLECNKDMLYRLLRMLAAHGIVKELPDGFILTTLGTFLQSDHPHTLLHFLKMEEPSRWYGYGRLVETIQTGVPSFAITFNKSYYDFIKEYPKLQDRLNKGLHDISKEENKKITHALELDAINSIVDVGAKNDELILELKNKYPAIQESIVLYYDSLDSNKHIPKFSKNTANPHQINFFNNSTIPHAKDNYILNRTLRAWDNKKSIKFLKQCNKAMRNSSTLYIIESLIPQDNDYHPSKDSDIIMMAVFGGKERTQDELEQLINQADLKITSIKPIPSSMLSLITVNKV